MSDDRKRRPAKSYGGIEKSLELAWRLYLAQEQQQCTNSAEDMENKTLNAGGVSRASISPTYIHQLLLSPGFMSTVWFMYSRLPLQILLVYGSISFVRSIGMTGVATGHFHLCKSLAWWIIGEITSMLMLRLVYKQDV